MLTPIKSNERTIGYTEERLGKIKDDHLRRIGRGNMLIELLLKNG